jgi:hypothetical protein
MRFSALRKVQKDFESRRDENNLVTEIRNLN